MPLQISAMSAPAIPTIHDPTAVLHPEILASIFQYVRNTSGPHDKEGRFTPDWVIFTYVCQRWRDIALAVPLLWDRVDLLAPGHGVARSMLERAQTVPLKVYATTMPYHGFPVKTFLLLWRKEILPRFAQLRTIHVDFESQSQVRTLTPPLQGAAGNELSPAPLLESLTFVFGSSAAMVVLTPSLKRAMPSLRYLRISDAISRWTRPLRVNINLLDHFPSCPRLVSLTLTSTKEGISFPIAQLLQSILPSMPLLEDIKLVESLTEVSEAQYHVLARLPKVRLPKLSTFYLCTRFYCNSVIFKVVQYPSTTKTTFYCLESSPPSTEVCTSMVSILSRLSDANGPPITHLGLRFYDEEGYLVVHAGPSSALNKHVEIVFRVPDDDSPSGSHVFQILRPWLPLRTIRNLVITGFEDMFDDIPALWEEFFADMPLLEEFSIHIAKQGTLLELLEASLENSKIFPALRCLDIFEVGPWPGEVLDTQMLWMLVEVARARQLAGNPIQELDLNFGVILDDDEVLEELADVIDAVFHEHVDPEF